MSLEPINDETALELYLADRRNELSEASLNRYKYRLGRYARWFEDQSIENLNALGGRHY